MKRAFLWLLVMLVGGTEHHHRLRHGHRIGRFLMKTVIGMVVFSLVTARGAGAAELEWKAGLATVKITPEKPVPMAGYASRTKPFEKVEQDIYAKALALEDRAGQRAVLVTTDLLGLSRAVAEPVCERIKEKTKISRSQILLN